MKWSVALTADGDRVLSREEIVALADAVAGLSGVASGIGTTWYGAQLLIDADTREAAPSVAREAFANAVTQAGLPAWPITVVEVIGEDDPLDDDAGW